MILLLEGLFLVKIHIFNFIVIVYSEFCFVLDSLERGGGDLIAFSPENIRPSEVSVLGFRSLEEIITIFEVPHIWAFVIPILKITL